MDITAICKDSLREGYTRKENPTLHVNSSSKLTFTRESKCNVQSDALFAVKLDPAVIEAQVTIENDDNKPTDKKNLLKSHKKKKDPKQHQDFENAMSLQRAALFSLSSEQYNLLMKYVDTIRQQRISLQKHLECGFCKNNGQPEVWYSTHALKDGMGRVRCPILRAFTCRRCGATGDHAHTFKYCPIKYY